MKKFEHIYVEQSIRNTERVAEILFRFPDSTIIEIDSYRDVFDRSRQNYSLQHASQNLILASKPDNAVYAGSPVCQSFDARYFYYCSSIMNCVYDCEYCFLKGMYPSGNLVVFVNLEEIFEQIETILQEHPMYICVSYDSDMLALEPILHYAEKWIAFTKAHELLTIEIRTKGASLKMFESLEECERVIYAFTLSPASAVDRFEHETPKLEERIRMIQSAQSMYRNVRLCFDPILIYPEWKQDYAELIQTLHTSVSFDEIRDISIGTFRLSKNYMKGMRRQYPDSLILQYPYVCENNFYQLPDKKREEAESFVVNELQKYGVSEEKIFLWRE